MFHVASICTPFAFCCVLLGVARSFCSVIAEAWRNNVGFGCTALPTSTHANYTWFTKVLWVVSFPLCTAAPNSVGNAHHCQHCWLNNVGSWPCSRGSKTNPNFQLVNKPSAGAVFRDQSRRSFTVVIVNTVYHLLMTNKKGEGRGFKKRERELVNFLPLKRGGELITEGGLKRGFTVLWFDVFSLRFVGTRRHVWLFFFFSYFGAKTILKLLFFVATTKSYLLHHPISIRGSHMKIIGQWK